MQQRHYARHARVGVWGSHALDKKVGVFFANNLRSWLEAFIKLCLKLLQTQTFFGVSIRQFIFSSYFCLFLFPRIASECDGEVCSGPKCVLRLWSEWGHLDHVPLVGTVLVPVLVLVEVLVLLCLMLGLMSFGF